MSPSSASHSGEQDPTFRGLVGIGRRDMTPEPGIYFHLWGNAKHEQADSIHRPLYATALCFQSVKGDKKVVIATIDYCWFPSHKTINELCDPLRAEFGLMPHEFLLIVTHSHAVPHVDEELESKPGGDKISAYRSKLFSALREAIGEAVSTTVPAIMSWASGQCSLARTRDFTDPDTGQILCGPNPQGRPDQTVMVGRVTSEVTGRPLATLVNYACHPVSLGGGNRSISPDYIGSLRQVLEARTGDAPCMFLHGPSGNQTPRDSYADDPAVADANGEILGFASLSVLLGMLPPGRRLVFKEAQSSGAPLAVWETREFEPDTVVDARMVYAHLPPKSWPKLEEIDEAIASASDKAALTRMTRLKQLVQNLAEGFRNGFPIWVIRLGQAVFVGIPAEAFTDLQVELRGRFPDLAIVVMNDTNGTYNYLPPAAYYGNGAYEQDCTDFGPGALEIVTMEAARLINVMLADPGTDGPVTLGRARQDRYTWT
jgi:hypothetical protein